MQSLLIKAPGGGPGGVRGSMMRPTASADLGLPDVRVGFTRAMKAHELIERNPEKMGGVPVFTGTKVPIDFLFQFLEDDQTVETFLDHFPDVSRVQAQGVLAASRELLLTSAH